MQNFRLNFEIVGLILLLDCEGIHPVSRMSITKEFYQIMQHILKLYITNYQLQIITTNSKTQKTLIYTHDTEGMLREFNDLIK